MAEPTTNAPEAAHDPHSGRAEATGEIPESLYLEASRALVGPPPFDTGRDDALIRHWATEHPRFRKAIEHVWHSRDAEVAELRWNLALTEEERESFRHAWEEHRDLVAELGAEVERLKPVVEAAVKLRHAGDDEAISAAWADFDEAIDAYEEADQ